MCPALLTAAAGYCRRDRRGQDRELREGRRRADRRRPRVEEERPRAGNLLEVQLSMHVQLGAGSVAGCRATVLGCKKRKQAFCVPFFGILCCFQKNGTDLRQANCLSIFGWAFCGQAC